ncbi:MAG: hypothetical protein IPL91_09875 [Hyphomicrobium sp.]|nr:hypothetical protein [Hyphomicrobium sp.]
MPMFRAGLAVAAMLIGGIAAFLGIVVALSALKTGSVSLSYGVGDAAVTETVMQAVDASRYWLLVGGLGSRPLCSARCRRNVGWRTISR